MKKSKKRIERLLLFFLTVLVVTVSVGSYGYASGLFMPADIENIMTDGVYTVMILGVDAEEGEDGRSDSVMIASLDKKSSELRLMSVPRDTYVRIGDTYDKINHAYALGGRELSVKTAEENFGIKIDGCIVFNFTSFRNFIDELGGINLYLSSGEAEEVKNIYEEGEYILDGREALIFSRIRNIDSDFGRTARHRRITDAILSRLKEENKANLPYLGKKLYDIIKSDIPLKDIMGLGLYLYDTDLDVESSMIPYEEDSWGEVIDGVWYLMADPEKTAEDMRTFLYGE